MKKGFYIIFYSFFLTIVSCGSITDFDENLETNVSEVLKDTSSVNLNNGGVNKNGTFKILSLGDSYTIGQNVCNSCKFPIQLVDTLLKITKNKSTFPLKVIARTGWTTTHLIGAIEDQNITAYYDLVTLLIGVNNQFQNKSFSIYEEEFPKLIDIAIKAAGNNAKNLVVLSIPDYAFTPYGNGNTTISTEIDKYNNFARTYCMSKGITFVNITEITRQGLNNKALVANDNLHPSKLAYKKFVEKILPEVLKKLELK
ncbi:SGNH/GDSL hydrolase family protein [Polaribacter cellanae]|uniref:SGNH/GDSL hydrolase family protein n=1 Tax=Polaribacter cellanae TaxID=2818493 RepID=A0A975H5J7_9FLAO|nr:SGNH/GDSL hydrolase family protein [Polaribacter cellanae]QTE21481.1 SGNH/GDSL hydrolase family protein [Polaribacter cellanae]